MEQQFQTSFIPKRPLTEDSAPRPRKVSIFNFLSTIFFVGTLVVSFGAYFYTSSLTSKLDGMKVDLEKEKETFDYQTIETISKLDRRIQGASDILSSHIAVSPLFALIEDITLETVQFDKFEFATEDTGVDTLKVSLSGVAPGYKSVGLQEEEFTKSRYIKNPVFSNLLLGEGGEVSFEVDFEVDAAYLNYSSNLSPASLLPEVASPSEVEDIEEVAPVVTETPIPTTTNTNTTTNTTTNTSGTGGSGSSFFGNPFESN